MERVLDLPRLSTNTSRAFCGCGVLLLFLPKINLVHFAEETAGLRIDDLILAGLCAFLVAVMSFGIRTSVSKFEILFFGLVAEAIASNCINLALFHRSSLFYSLRLLEYFLFFYLGIYFTHSLVRVAQWLLIANAAVMFLQVAGLVGAATSEGVATSIQGRAVGLTGGPWEVGTVINFCCAIIAFDKHRGQRRGTALFTFLAGFVLLLLTGSRMATIAQVVLVLMYFYLQSKNALRFITISVALLAVVISAIVLIPNPVAKRSEKLFDADNIQAFKVLYQRTPDDPTMSGLADFTVVDDTADLSWVIRAAKWAGAIKAWNRSPMSILFGIGPGTLGPSLDGGWLRVLSETGAAGLLLYLLFCRYIFRNTDWQMRAVLVSLLINMLMVDIHIAYKAMSFFMFCLGYLFRESLARSLHLRDAA